jgi:hypothetical protein
VADLPSTDPIAVRILPGDAWMERPPHETWPFLARVTAVTIDLSGLGLVDTRAISWLLDLRASVRVRVVVLANPRVYAALRMLGLQTVFTLELVDPRMAAWARR